MFVSFIDKQASDDEDNEIEIVEPKTDLITLDSDDEEPVASSTLSGTQTAMLSPQKSIQSNSNSPNSLDVKVKPTMIQNTITAPATDQTEENIDLMSMAQSFLASMLEVDVQEASLNSPGSDSSGQKKQPRKKLTNKPNPTLLKQKALMERERLEELKRNDLKLKMKCSIELKKAEEEYPFAKSMIEAIVKGNKEIEEDTNQAEKEELEKKKLLKLLLESDKETVEVELILDEENGKSSTKQNKTLENDSAASTGLNQNKEKQLNDDPHREEGKEQSAEINIVGNNKNNAQKDLENKKNYLQNKSATKESIKVDEITVSETITKTVQIGEVGKEIGKDNTTNENRKLDNEEHFVDTDKNKNEHCNQSALESEIKESLNDVKNSREGTMLETNVSNNEKNEKFQQPHLSNTTDKECTRPNENENETSNNIREVVIGNDKTSDAPGEQEMISSIDKSIQITETSATTSNGSV